MVAWTSRFDSMPVLKNSESGCGKISVVSLGANVVASLVSASGAVQNAKKKKHLIVALFVRESLRCVFKACMFVF
jgi:hypothetical protein